MTTTTVVLAFVMFMVCNACISGCFEGWNLRKLRDWDCCAVLGLRVFFAFRVEGLGVLQGAE